MREASPPASHRAKRVFDVALATAGLVLTSPVLAASAIAVRLDSPGPVFFRQERIGRGGRVFRIHKFRTMAQGADGLAVSTSSDARITRVGKVLRKSKIDELPQLIDVVRGEMSLVGPRPEVAKYVAQWSEDARDVILSVRPGITDPASVAMRNESEILESQSDPENFYVSELLPLKTKMYVDYVQSQTLFGDLKVILATFRTVVRD